ncbi:MAG: 1-acyl-sn-glycerol-3-phosphate acyltransferase [Dysgonamonadaceae bacterium]
MRDKLVSYDDIRKIHPIFRGKYGDKFIKWGIKLAGLEYANDIYDNSKHLTGPAFCKDALDKLQISRTIRNADILEQFKDAPFITVSNHPYGHIDGISLIETVGSRVSNFKVMVNFILGIIDTMEDNFVTVVPYKTVKPTATSINGIKECIAHIRDGNPLGFFPAGSTSRINFIKGRWVFTDREWQTSILKLIQKANVPVIPIHFSGRNSVFYYLLRRFCGWKVQTMQLCHELANKKNHEIIITIGDPIPSSEIDLYKDTKDLEVFLRSKTYALADTK